MLLYTTYTPGNTFVGGRATLFVIRNPHIPKESFSTFSVKLLTKAATYICLLKNKQICPNPNTSGVESQFYILLKKLGNCSDLI